MMNATTTSIVYLQEIKQDIGGGKKEESEGEGYIIYTCRERGREKREEGRERERSEVKRYQTS